MSDRIAGTDICPICRKNYKAARENSANSERWYHCLVCGIFTTTKLVEQTFTSEPALLPFLKAYIRQQNLFNGVEPTVDANWSNAARAHQHSSIEEKENKLLLAMAKLTDRRLGQTVVFTPSEDCFLADEAESEGMLFLLRNLTKRGLIAVHKRGGDYITKEGWEYLDKFERGPAPTVSSEKKLGMNLLPPDRAIELLRKQHAEPVEGLSYEDPKGDTWQHVTLSVIERAFGPGTRQVSRFSGGPAFAAYDPEVNQDDYQKHIATKKAWIEAFIEELQLLPPERPSVTISRQGVYFAGQTFDALMNAAKIFTSAQNEIVLIDGYIDGDTLAVLKGRPGVSIKILTRPLEPAQKAFCAAFNNQYGGLSVRSPSKFHDRFAIVDSTDVYHFGASVKGLGKKTFMFTLIEEQAIVSSVRSQFSLEWKSANLEV